MNEYHKIQTVFKRDPETNFKTLLEGDWSEPEFGYLAKNEWVFTEKVDGTNIRVIVEPDRLRFGGKTDKATTPPFLIERLQERFVPQTAWLHDMFPNGACLYGEGYGARIQKGGGKYRADPDFVLFDVLVRSKCALHPATQPAHTCHDWWLQRETVEDIARKLSLDIVPIIGRGTLFDMVDRARSGIISIWGDFAAEGIVARPAVELQTRAGKRIITKIKSRDFVSSNTSKISCPAREGG